MEQRALTPPLPLPTASRRALCLSRQVPAAATTVASHGVLGSATLSELEEDLALSEEGETTWPPLNRAEEARQLVSPLVPTSFSSPPTSQDSQAASSSKRPMDDVNTSEESLILSQKSPSC